MDLGRFTRFDWYSIAAIPIEVFFQEQKLATGTAFFWEHESQTYLVTAWHNLSGRHYQTGRHLSSTAAEPDRIRVWWNVDAQPVGQKKAQFISIHDAVGDPLWLIHPKRGSGIDIALLPVDPPAGMEPYPINRLPEGPINQGMGQEVFILGFPLGVGPVGLPIWKRGSLASEPQIMEEVQPYWLIDTASRPGMSGAPVIERSYDYEYELGQVFNHGHRGKSSFLGVYSGRLATDSSEDAQLGIVWPSWYIEQILAGQKRDRVQG